MSTRYHIGSIICLPRHVASPFVGAGFLQEAPRIPGLYKITPKGYAALKQPPK